MKHKTIFHTEDGNGGKEPISTKNAAVKGAE